MSGILDQLISNLQNPFLVTLADRQSGPAGLTKFTAPFAAAHDLDCRPVVDGFDKWDNRPGWYGGMAEIGDKPFLHLLADAGDKDARDLGQGLQPDGAGFLAKRFEDI